VDTVDKYLNDFTFLGYSLFVSNIIALHVYTIYLYLPVIIPVLLTFIYTPCDPLSMHVVGYYTSTHLLHAKYVFSCMFYCMPCNAVLPTPSVPGYIYVSILFLIAQKSLPTPIPTLFSNLPSNSPY
jgi:hypothetical protein